MQSAVVCIDLGSAYTKVGVRQGFNDDARVPSVAGGDDDGFLIPSVIAEVNGKLVFGQEAAAQSQGARRFHNWKRALFSTEHGGAGSLIHGYDVRALSTAFLSHIRTSHCTRLGVGELPVRICIPKLRNARISEAEILGIARAAGFHVASASPIVFEPESNALGILTRGRNHTWTPPQLPYQPPTQREALYPQMFEHGIAARYRQHGLAGTDGLYRVLLVDMGAYTTDFAMVALPVGFGGETNERPRVLQSSIDLGIAALDERIYMLLPAEAQSAIRSLSVSRWEQLKRSLYQLKEIRVRHGDAQFTLGGDSPHLSSSAIRSVLTAHADAVVAGQEAFLNEHRIRGIDEVIYSGGGFFIGAIADRLRTKGQQFSWNVTDLLAGNGPGGYGDGDLSRLSGHAASERNRNVQLARTGSAVGGCSVFFR